MRRQRSRRREKICIYNDRAECIFPYHHALGRYLSYKYNEPRSDAHEELMGKSKI